MSLRARLVASIVAALLLSFAAGAVLATWHAARAVRTELTAALASAEATATAALAAEAPTPDALRRLVASFNGNRHIRATLAHPPATSSPPYPPPHPPGFNPPSPPRSPPSPSPPAPLPFA